MGGMSFRGRLLLAFLAGAAAVVAFGLSSYHLLATGAAEDALLERLEREARAVAAAMATGGPDREAADRLGAALGVRIVLLDAEGEVLGAAGEEPGSGVPGPGSPRREEVRQSLAAGRAAAWRGVDGRGEEAAFAAAPLPGGGGAVRLQEPLARVRARIRGITGVLAALAALATVAAGGVGARLGQPLGRLVADLTAATRRLSAGDSGARSPGTERADELGDLARAFNQLAGQLEVRHGELVRERNLLEAILEGMAEAVLAVGPHREITLANSAFRRMFPRLPVQAGDDAEALIRVPELLSALERVARTGRPSDPEEVRVGGPRGRHLAFACAPFGLGAERGVVAVFHDISELKRVEKLRRDLVANVSHELRTPLTAIQGFGETLLDGALQDRQVARSFIERIHRQARRLSALVDDLLDLAKIESGELRMDAVAQRLGPIVEEALDAVRPRAEAGSVRLVVDLAGDAVPQGDRRAVVHVLTNLLGNALDHTGEGGEVTVSARVREGAVRVAVSDTGIGIPEEHLDRIFERFYRVERGRERRGSGGGTGLGLAIVKHLVLAQGGSLGVESTVGKGSTFHFDLPRAGGAAPPAVA
ncbi:ATP-binding protein [Myxococcota bacterium]|nr:ATP-binding protein [Myxococcota bacterium]